MKEMNVEQLEAVALDVMEKWLNKNALSSPPSATRS